MEEGQPRRCPSCGARNPPDAEWCGQCFESFVGPDEAVEDRGEPGTATGPEGPLGRVVSREGPPAPPGGAEDAVVDPGLPDWACPICGRRNPLEASRCSVCGTDFFELIRPKTEESRIAPSQAATLSLILPGLGHIRLGQGMLGVIIGLLAITALAFAVVAGVVVGAAVWGWLLGLVAVGLWAVGALDAYHLGLGRPDETILRPRVLSVVAAVVLVLFVLGITTGVGQVEGGS